MVLLLEVARGLAALWVFFYHVKALFEDASPLIYQLASYGYLGVPMFFVISGYVITYSAESTIKNGRASRLFLKNRFLRIYPAFWASIVVILVTPYLIEAISALKSGQLIWPEAPFLTLSGWEWLNLVLLTKVFWADSPNLQEQFTVINSVYWTLAIEFQFYLVVFIALLLRPYYRWTIGLVTIAGCVSLFLPDLFGYRFNDGLFLTYWPSFAIGIGLAYLHRAGVFVGHKWTDNLVGLVALPAVGTALALADWQLAKQDFLFALFFGACLWVIAGLESKLVLIKHGNSTVRYWLLEPWLILGAMSYSVYLLHGKIYLLPLMFVRQAISPQYIGYGLVTMLGTLALCFVFYYAIERRFLSKNYQTLHRQVLTNQSIRR